MAEAERVGAHPCSRGLRPCLLHGNTRAQFLPQTSDAHCLAHLLRIGLVKDITQPWTIWPPRIWRQLRVSNVHQLAGLRLVRVHLSSLLFLNGRYKNPCSALPPCASKSPPLSFATCVTESSDLPLFVSEFTTLLS